MERKGVTQSQLAALLQIGNGGRYASFWLQGARLNQPTVIAAGAAHCEERAKVAACEEDDLLQGQSGL